MVDFVCNVQAKPAKNYGLVKTHKPGQKLRVITAGTCSAVSNLSAFKERFLGPLSRSKKPLLVDTTDFLNLIEHLNTSFSPIPEHVILVTWDIEAMYPSKDNKIGLQACRKILDSREVLKPSTDCLLDAIRITLDNNNSTFNNTHYLQTDGTAMGPKNACSYADVSVSKIDELVFQHEYLKPICWGRYRDDCFGLWNGSLEELCVFTSYLSSIYPSIRFTVRFDCHKIEFLDVLVVKQNGRLETTVYSKETDGHMYLLPSSSHFHSVSDNIPYGVALRLKRICSTEEEFSKKSIEYKNHLLARGYKRIKVKKQFQKANFFSRETLLIKQPKISSNKKIVLNLDYHPTLRDVGSIIKRHLPILYKSVAMKETFNPDKTSIMIGFRRHKNLKEIPSPAAFPTNKNKQVVLDTGCKKCNKKCYVCRDFLQESPTITSLATGIKYKIKESLSCKDDWVVYCATCLKCQKQDVGSTVTEFYTRWSNHKSHINTKKKTCALAKHFIEQKCGLQNVKVTLIEKVKVKNLDYLEDREGHWQRQLFTMQPHGLNVRKEFEGGTHKSFFKYY